MHIIDTLWPHGSPCILYSVLSSGQNSSRYSGHMGAIPRLFYLRRKLHQILLLYSDSVFITLTLSPCPINDSVFRDHHYHHTFSKEARKKFKNSVINHLLTHLLIQSMAQKLVFVLHLLSIYHQLESFRESMIPTSSSTNSQ